MFDWKRIPNYTIASDHGLTLGLPPRSLLKPFLTISGNRALTSLYQFGSALVCLLVNTDGKIYDNNMQSYVQKIINNALDNFEKAEDLCSLSSYIVAQNSNDTDNDEEFLVYYKDRLIVALNALDLNFKFTYHTASSLKNFEGSEYKDSGGAMRALISHLDATIVMYSTLQRKLYNIAELIYNISREERDNDNTAPKIGG